jgi:hypothetical protein
MRCVFSSDYDVSCSQGDIEDIGSSKDGADSSVGDVYCIVVINDLRR